MIKSCQKSMLNKKAKLKLLLIVTQSQWGGAQRYVFDLANNLKNDFDITVACGQGGLLIDKLHENNIAVKVFKNLVRNINLFKDLACFWQVYRFIKRKKFDIVHTNSSKAEILGNLAAKLARTPKIIFTAHGFVFNEPLGKLKKIFFIGCEKFAAKFADKIITVSDFDRKTAIENKIVKTDKFITVYNGVKCFEKVKLKETFDSMKITVGTVANFYPVKGLKYFIDAAKIVCEKFPRVKFKIIGDGFLRPQLEQQIKALHLENVVDLVGFKKDIFAIMKTMDIFVLASLKEGLPYAILEAQSLGLPIIATNVGGIPEIIQDQKTGILVTAQNPDQLAQKIQLLIKNQNLRLKLAQAGQHNIKNNFNLSKMLEQTKAIYEAS